MIDHRFPIPFYYLQAPYPVVRRPYLEQLLLNDPLRCQLAQDMYALGKFDEFGVIQNPDILDLIVPVVPPERIKWLCDFLEKQLHLKTSFMQFAKEIDDETVDWQIVGSLAPYLLSFEYYQKILEELGVEILPNSPYAALLNEVTQFPKDVDIRILYKGTEHFKNINETLFHNDKFFDLTLQELKVAVEVLKKEFPQTSFEEIEKKLSEFTPDEQTSLRSFHTELGECKKLMWKKEFQIAHQALQQLQEKIEARLGEKVVDWKDDDDGHMLLIATKGKIVYPDLSERTIKVDISAVHTQCRQHIYSSDNSRVNMNPIVRTDLAAASVLRPEGDFQVEVSRNVPINPRQSAVDRIFNIDRIDNVESLNVLACARRLVNKTKGRLLLGYQGETTEMLEYQLLQQILRLNPTTEYLTAALFKSISEHLQMEPEIFDAFVQISLNFLSPKLTAGVLFQIQEGLYKRYKNYEEGELGHSEDPNLVKKESNPEVAVRLDAVVEAELVVEEDDVVEAELAVVQNEIPELVAAQKSVTLSQNSFLENEASLDLNVKALDSLRWLLQMKRERIIEEADFNLFKEAVAHPELLKDAIPLALKLLTSIFASQKSFKEAFVKLHDQLLLEKLDDQNIENVENASSDPAWLAKFFASQGKAEKAAEKIYVLSRDSQAELPKVNVSLSAEFLQKNWLEEKLTTTKRIGNLKRVASFVAPAELGTLWSRLLVEHLESSKEGSLKKIKNALNLLVEVYPLVPQEPWEQNMKIISSAFDILTLIVSKYQKMEQFSNDHYRLTAVIMTQMGVKYPKDFFLLEVINSPDFTHPFYVLSSKSLDPAIQELLWEINALYAYKILEASFSDVSQKKEMLASCAAMVRLLIENKEGPILEKLLDRFIGTCETDPHTFPRHWGYAHTIYMQSLGKISKKRSDFYRYFLLRQIDPQSDDLPTFFLEALNTRSSLSLWLSLYRYLDQESILRTKCSSEQIENIFREFLKGVELKRFILPDTKEMKKHGCPKAIFERAQIDSHKTDLDLVYYCLFQTLLNLQKNEGKNLSVIYSKTVHRLALGLLDTKKALNVWRTLFLLLFTRSHFLSAESESLLQECFERLLAVEAPLHRLKCEELESFQSLPKNALLSSNALSQKQLEGKSYEVQIAASHVETDLLINNILAASTQILQRMKNPQANILKRQFCHRVMDWLENVSLHNDLNQVLEFTKYFGIFWAKACNSGIFMEEKGQLIALLKRLIKFFSHPDQAQRDLIQKFEKAIGMIEKMG